MALMHDPDNEVTVISAEGIGKGVLEGNTIRMIGEPNMPRSYKAEVIADSSGKWTGNGLAFATAAEAQSYVDDLMMRWFAVREVRTVQSTDPVNTRWDAEAHRSEPVKAV